MDLDQLLIELGQNQGSDLHIKTGRPPLFRIAGEKIERLAAMTDFDTDDGRAYFERVLARSGARRKLEKLGLRPGDTIRVGDREYVYS